MESFIESVVVLYDKSKSKILLNLLHNPNVEFRLAVNKSTSKLKCNKRIEMGKRTNRIGAIKRKILNNPEKLTKRVRSMPKSKSNEYLHNDELNSSLNMSALNRRDEFFVFDYSIELIASQLTLIEWVYRYKSYHFFQNLLLFLFLFMLILY